MTGPEFVQVAQWIADGVCRYRQIDTGRWVNWDAEWPLKLVEDSERFRRRPEPKLRAFTISELPVDAWFKRSYGSQQFRIVGIDPEANSVWFVDACSKAVIVPMQPLAEHWLYSTDNRTSWKPCKTKGPA